MNSIHITKNAGLSEFKIFWMRSNCGKYHWCRRAISIFGSLNTSLEYVNKTSPFEPGYQENYVEGKASSREEALKLMEEDAKRLCDSLWF